jgi:HlyD family secretion protein
MRLRLNARARGPLRFEHRVLLTIMKKGFLKSLAAGIVILGLAGGTLAWRLGQKREPAQELMTAPVQRTNLVSTISATGTVEPEEVVDVGAQVAGQIREFGKDKNGKPIDYGSAVEADTVLAQIDDSLYRADVESAKAALQQAEANQLSAKADVQQMQAKLTQAQEDWNRAQKLGPSDALAPSAFDQYKSNYQVAQANVAAAQAAVEQSKAALAQAQANLDRAQRNLGYCTITSPVKGVIIDRRVNIGQTVVSSLNAPSLFLIAKDLTRIQVWVSVNEADIGSIHPGMPALFTVDAFPSQVFHGQVGKVRLNATMTQNVVTYTVEVTTDNSDGKLLPYLTANVQFVTGSREKVLAVPDAALHWHPQAVGRGSVERGSVGAEPAHAAGGATPEGTIWVRQGETLRPIEVRVGLTDGSRTEVKAAGLTEGVQVVVGDKSPELAASPGGGASPFTPQFGRGRSSK